MKSFLPNLLGNQNTNKQVEKLSFCQLECNSEIIPNDDFRLTNHRPADG